MKVLYATSIFLPSVRANRIQILAMAKAFAGVLGDDFLLGIGANKDGQDLGCRTVEMCPNVRSYSLAWRYLRIAKKEKFTHIFCREEKLLFFMVLYALLTNARVSFSYELHHLVYLRKWWFRWALSRTDAVVSITKGMLAALAESGYRGKTLVAPDAVDPSLFHLPHLSKSAARTELGLPHDRAIALYAGSLDPWKGVGVLHESAPFLDPKTLVVVVGGKPHYIQEFKEMHGDGHENFRMVGHKEYETELPKYLRAADVAVLPNSGKEEISRIATSPLKLFAYMASGTPIVASDLPSIREILDESNAVLVHPDSALMLARGIERVLDHPEKAHVLAVKAKHDAGAYTWDKRAKSVVQFLNA
jgi:glycosyltransferase involved in cell wall biosynthesis